MSARPAWSVARYLPRPSGPAYLSRHTHSPTRRHRPRVKRSRQKKMGETPISYSLIAHEVRAATDRVARQPAYSLILYGFGPICNAWRPKSPPDGHQRNIAAPQNGEAASLASPHSSQPPISERSNTFSANGYRRDCHGYRDYRHRPRCCYHRHRRPSDCRHDCDCRWRYRCHSHRATGRRSRHRLRNYRRQSVGPRHAAMASAPDNHRSDRQMSSADWHGDDGIAPAHD